MSVGKQVGLFVGLVAMVWFATQSFYVVSETEQVVLTEFGKPVGVQTEAGLQFKWPWRTLHVFDKRLIRWDGRKSEIPTKDKKFIEIDTTARWRIVDPQTFLESVGTVNSAQARLDDVIDSTVRQAVTENILIEIVRSDRKGAIIERLRRESVNLDEQGEAKKDSATSGEDDLFYRIVQGREAIQQLITDRATKIIREEFGIELRDVRIKRLNYIDDVRKTIYRRMITERNKIAEKYRSQGRGQSASIAGEMERDLRIIRSEAGRQAREVEGEADAVAARIYTRAYDVDAEFYSFYQTLASYRTAIGKGVRPIMRLDSEYFTYLQSRGGRVIEEGERQQRLKDVQATLKAIDDLGSRYGGGPSAKDRLPGALPGKAPVEAPRVAPKPAPKLEAPGAPASANPAGVDTPTLP